MKVRILPPKRALRAALIALLIGAGATNLQAQTGNITFADDHVKAICVANWDTNNDGELSYAEAAAVTDLGTVFGFNDSITSFDELQNFTGLTAIGNSTFINCHNLASVTFPNTLCTIGNNAFINCRSLTSILLPSSITDIGENAFIRCSALAMIKVDADTPPAFGAHAFYMNAADLLIYIPCGSLAAYQSATGWSGLSNYVEVCSSVITATANSAEGGTVSGAGPFEAGEICSLTATANSGYEFANWTENGIIVSTENPYSFMVICNRDLVANFNSTGDIVFQDPNVKAICVANWDTNNDGELSYAEAAAVTTLNPSGENYQSVFRDNTSITTFNELQYFTGLTFIGYGAFSRCSNLTSVRIPSAVTSIEGYAFGYCSSLDSITLPNLVTHIHSYAFSNCSSLSSVSLPNSLVCIGERAFFYCSGLTQLEIPSSVTTIEEGAFWWSGLTSMVIPNTVTSLCSRYLFYECENLTSVTLPNNITSIQDHAFFGCSNLASIDIPNTVTAIEGSAFSACNALTSIVIPEQVTSIGDYAFSGTSNLESIVLPNTLTSIGENAFRNCGLKTLNLPESVTSIGEFAFCRCENLVELYIPNSLNTIKRRTFVNCNALTFAHLGQSLEYIEDGAFSGCSSLRTLYLGPAMRRIEYQAFMSCSNLSFIKVDATFPPVIWDQWGLHTAFDGVPKNIPVIVPEGSVSRYQQANRWKEFTNIQAAAPRVITATADLAEGGTVSGAGSFGDFQMCTLTATPNPGYALVKWTENDTIVSTDSTYTFMVMGNRNFVANFASTEPIVFADSIAKALCVANWDTNGDGELSYAEAAAVTDLDDVFTAGFGGVISITSFNELKYFTGLTSIASNSFIMCQNLTSVEIPKNVTDIYNFGFFYCVGLTSLTVHAETPPVLHIAALEAVVRTIPLNVPCSSVAAYQAAAGWSGFTNIGCSGNITVTVNIAENGTVSGAGTYHANTTCTLTATPNPGCEFVSWTENGTVISTDSVYSFSVVGDRHLKANFGSTEPIDFAHSLVKNLCVANWDTNGDGELSYAEAMAVTDLGSVFDSQYIHYFDELQYFTGLTTLNDRAFYFCRSLRSITLPNTVESIGEFSFYRCWSLPSIEIPETVVSIERHAFNQCESLTSVKVNCVTPPALEEEGAFTSLGTVVCYVSVPCESLEDYRAIDGWNSFGILGCPGVITVTANPAEGGTVSGMGAFEGGIVCTLTATPDNESYAFINWTENDTVVSSDNPYVFNVAGDRDLVANFGDGTPITFEDDNVKAICVANWDTNNDGELSYAEAAAVTTLNPSGEYYQSVFRGNTSITTFNELQYFTGLTFIDEMAFMECRNLTSVRIPNTVKEIKYGAFYECDNLYHVEIPSQVESIGSYAFYRLGSIKVNAITPPVVYSNTFYGTQKTIPVLIPEGTLEAYQSAPVWDLFLNYATAFSPGVITATAIPAEGGTVSGTGAYEAFDRCTLTATANEGYRFVDWTENGNRVSRDASYTFTVSGDRHLDAQFVSTDPIVFADPNVKTALLNTSWYMDPNGDGEISYYEAATMTTLFDAFKNNTTITSFDELQYFGLTSIADDEFVGCTALTSVTFPNSITSIGNNAFKGCSNLASVTLSNSVSDIGTSAFQGCSSLASITFPNSVSNIGTSAFQGCSSLVSITLPNSITTIKESTFKDCQALDTVIIPNSVTSIEREAFYGCPILGKVVIPSSITSIGVAAFYNASAETTRFYMESDTPPYTALASLGNADFIVFIPCGSFAAYQADPYFAIRRLIESCPDVVTATAIPAEGGTFTGEGIYNCSETCTLTANANAGYQLVDWRENGTVVSHSNPYTFTVLGNRHLEATFASSDPILFADDTVKAICVANWDTNGDGELSYAEARRVTTLNPSGENYQSVFRVNTSITSFDELQYFTELTSIEKGTFQDCSNLASVVIPNSVTAIDNRAFQNCNLASVEIPAHVTFIGEAAFRHCFNLTSVKLPDSLEVFTNYVFEGCGFTSIEIPNTVTRIGWESFKGCTRLRSVDIPNSVTIIAYGAFAWCDSLTTVRIPNSVTTIRSYAFRNCTNLNLVWVDAPTPPTLDDDVFENMPSGCTIIVPCGSLAAYKTADKWKNLTSHLVDDCSLFFRFNTEGNWSEASNWNYNLLPQGEDRVIIDANCQLNQDATVATLSVTDGKTLTLETDNTLTVTGALSNSDAAGLVIEDGAQLYNASDNVNATVKKSISAYTPNLNDGWHLIALPLATSVETGSVDNLLSNDYDLYYYDEPTHYWMNHEFADNGFTALQPGQGYLYANDNAVELQFSGNIKSGTATVSIPLSYASTDGILMGFNLVGNPFVHNVTAYTGNNVADECYRMNDTKDNLMVSTISATDPLKPSEGFFVKATADGASLTFNSGAKGSERSLSQSKGRINLELRENGLIIDRFILKRDGEPLEKFTLRENGARIFALRDNQEMAVVVAEGNEQPVNFKAAKNGTYTLNVNVENMDLDYLHLIDHMTGEDMDLLATSTGSVASYTFYAKTTDYASRFKLVFSAASAGSAADEAFAFIDAGGNIVITADAHGASLQVIDMMGRVIVSVGGHTRCVPTTGIPAGMYVLRLIDGENVRTQKIVVE